MFELLEELVLVEVLVEELVPVLLWESLSVVQLPLEQLFERELDLLVDFETVTDLLPIRTSPLLLERAARSEGADTVGTALAAERATPRMPAARANALGLAMARAPLSLAARNGRLSGHLNTDGRFA
ncbi:hypothetical protein N7E70_011735 [Aminobacter sp. NyZ550]|uniref:hypothetical protein n=1 Tax=Aminobacter sp. NyZ550 TaxID=2979870 RepID=UPI0022B23E5A|nr:hypothetical protein [Aminobacter sp. NyZ550]WAX97472.1 hypothetical protein N7E70_011735 [Aminobacter sp. NyZ550]